MRRKPDNNISEFAKGRRPVRFRHDHSNIPKVALLFEAECQTLARDCEQYEDVFVELHKLEDRTLFFDIISFLEEAGFFRSMAGQVTFISKCLTNISDGILKSLIDKYTKQDPTQALRPQTTQEAISQKCADAENIEGNHNQIMRWLKSEIARTADPEHRPLYSSMLAHVDIEHLVLDMLNQVKEFSSKAVTDRRGEYGIDIADPYYAEKCVVADLGPALQQLDRVQRQMISAIFFCKEAALRGAKNMKVDPEKMKDSSRALLEKIRDLNMQPFTIHGATKEGQSIFLEGEDMELTLPQKLNATEYFQGKIKFKLTKNGNYPMELNFCISRANGELCIADAFLSSLRVFFKEYHIEDYYEELKLAILSLLNSTSEAPPSPEQPAEAIEEIEETTEEIVKAVEAIAPDTTEGRPKKLVGSKRLQNISSRRAQRALASFGVVLGRSTKHFIFQRELNGRTLMAPFSHGTAKRTNPIILRSILDSLEIPLEEFLERI